MASFILTRASLRTDVRIPPDGDPVRFMLTRASMSSGNKIAFMLTRAKMFSSSAEFPTEISLGQSKIVPPFRRMEVVASAPTGIHVDHWTWQISSSNPRAKMAGRFRTKTTFITGDTFTYLSPASVKGTVLTISATAHVTGRADTTATVVHQVKPHSWPWHINTQGKYYPVLELPNGLGETMAIKTNQVSVGTIATRLDVATDADYDADQIINVRMDVTGSRIYIGGADVTTGNGMFFDPGDAVELSLQAGDQLFGIKASGTQVVYVMQVGV